MIELNKIYNIDCAVGLKDIPSGSIDLIVTDPPYEVNVSGGGGTVNTKLHLDESLKDLVSTNDITKGYDIEMFSQEVERIQGKNINSYFWCNKAQIPKYFDVYVGKLGCKFEIICWHKVNALPTFHGKYLSDTEYCLYFHKGSGVTMPKSYNEAKTYFLGNINTADKELYGHPTIKPIQYIQTLIRNSSKEGDTILDPFIGSGTTAIACIREKRNYVGFEICKEYYDITTKRIKNERQQLTLDL